MPQYGENIPHILMNTKGEKSAPIFSPDEDMLTMVQNPEAFYNDLPEATIKDLSSKLVPRPTAPQIGAAKNLAWNYVPSTYIYCFDDLALPIGCQREMVQAVREQVGEVLEETLSGSHSIFASQRENMVGCVKRAWEVDAPTASAAA